MLDECGSGMEPIAITVRGKGEWVLIHRCTGCGVLHLNRSAADDSPLLLVRLAVKPLALPPVPRDRLALVEGAGSVGWGTVQAPRSVEAASHGARRTPCFHDPSTRGTHEVRPAASFTLIHTRYDA